MKKKFLKLKDNSYFLGFVFGLLLSIGRFDIGLHFVIFFSFLPLLYLLDNLKSLTSLVKFSLASSLTFTVVALHWIMIALNWISLGTTFVYFLLIPLFFVYFFITFFVMKICWIKKGIYRYGVLILCWSIFELLTHLGEFRFPWFHLGYNLSEYLFLIQVADIGGMIGLTIIILFINILFYNMIISGKYKKNMIILVTIFALWLGYGFFRIKNLHLEVSDKIVGVVQGSFEQDQKWALSYRNKIIPRYKKLSLEAKKNGADLVVWPESAIPFYLLKDYRKQADLMLFAKRNDFDIFTGFQDYDFLGKKLDNYYVFYNSATLISKKGEVLPPYAKQILVPFGERLPFLEVFPFLRKLDFGQANFEYGKKNVLFNYGEFKFLSLICFEIAFPNLFYKMDLQDLDFIVNLTNDAWFRKSVGTYQHSEMTKFRAVEIRRQFFRTANTGISMVVDPLGRITSSIPLFKKGFINGNLVKSDVLTFYYKFGETFECIIFILGVVYLVLGKIFLRSNK